MAKPLILINGRFLTQPITGVQRYATEVISAISRLQPNYKIVIKSPKTTIKSFPYLEQDNSSLCGHMWEQVRLPWLAKKLNANLLWCPCNTAPMFRSKTKLLVTIHDCAVFAGPEWFSVPFRLFYKKAIPRIGNISNKIITVSNFSKSELIKYNIVREDKITVIYEGIEHLYRQLTVSNINTRGGLPCNNQGKPYILTLGSRDPRKNLNNLLSAWDKLSSREKKGKVLVVAGGKSTSFAEEKIKKIKEDVIFLGYVPDEKLPYLYKHAEAFVFPSFYEGFGFPPLEAMVHGTPTMVAEAGSLSEICGDAALYCDPNSVNDIAEKMALLLNDSDLRAKLQEHGKRQLKKYSWAECAKKHIRIIAELI